MVKLEHCTSAASLRLVKSLPECESNAFVVHSCGNMMTFIGVQLRKYVCFNNNPS